MAVDMFINFGDKIKGETQDQHQKAKNDSDVLAYSWGMSQTGSFHTGGGGGAGKVHVQDLSFTKYADTASTALMSHCCTGVHIPKVVLLVRKAGGDAAKPGLNDMMITMSKVIVTSVSTGGSGGEDRFTENVTLNFAEVKVEKFQQDDKGTVKPAGELTWDIAANSGK
jgi:type VI secretion system secreted protein Hcp